MATYTSHYPVAYSTSTVKTTNAQSGSGHAVANPSNPLTGSAPWLSAAGTGVPIKWNIDCDTAFVCRRVYIENYHHNGLYTNRSVRAAKIYGTNESTAFDNVDGTVTTDLTLLATVEFAQHAEPLDGSDPHYHTFSNETSFRYYVIICETDWGAGNFKGIRRLEFQSAEPGNDCEIIGGFGLACTVLIDDVGALISSDFGLSAEVNATNETLVETATIVSGFGLSVQADAETTKAVQISAAFGLGTWVRAEFPKTKYVRVVSGFGLHANVEAVKAQRLSISAAFGLSAVVTNTGVTSVGRARCSFGLRCRGDAKFVYGSDITAAFGLSAQVDSARIGQATIACGFGLKGSLDAFSPIANTGGNTSGSSLPAFPCSLAKHNESRWT